jgi:membrane protease YdiL (CAAX protease family)
MTSQPVQNNTQRYLNLWAFILIIWTIYRVKFSFPEGIDEFIIKPFVFLFPVFIYIKAVEKKNFFSGIGFDIKKFIPDLLIGLLVGLLFFSSAVILKYIRNGTLTPSEMTIFSNPQAFGYAILIAFATAISEEVLSRGFVLKRLYEDSKNVISSSFLSSILFFHTPHSNYVFQFQFERHLSIIFYVYLSKSGDCQFVHIFTSKKHRSTCSHLCFL